MILSASTNCRVVIAGKGARLLFEGVFDGGTDVLQCGRLGANQAAAFGSSLLHAARRIVLKINTEAVFLYMGTPEDDGLSDGLTCLS